MGKIGQECSLGVSFEETESFFEGCCFLDSIPTGNPTENGVYSERYIFGNGSLRGKRGPAFSPNLLMHFGFGLLDHHANARSS